MWIVTPCSREGVYQRFGGTYHFHLQGIQSGSEDNLPTDRFLSAFSVQKRSPAVVIVMRIK
jgi:hypothetical protein